MNSQVVELGQTKTEKKQKACVHINENQIYLFCSPQESRSQIESTSVELEEI